MGMRTVARIDRIRIREHGRDGALYLVFHSAATGKDVCRKLPTRNLNSAKRAAATLNRELKSQHTKLERTGQRVPVKDAIDEAIRHSRSNDPHHRYNLGRFAAYALDWLAKRYPALEYWDTISSEMLSAWVDDLHRQGRSRKTAESYTGVLVQTANYWHLERPQMHNVLTPSFAVYGRKQPRQKHYLSARQAMELLKLAERGNSQTSICAIALGCFAGLNPQEVRWLRVGSFDVENGVLQIVASKNEVSRPRTIPLLSIVTKTMRKVCAGRHPEEWLLRPQANGHDMATEPAYLTVSRAVSKTLSIMCKALDKSAETATPKQREKHLADKAAFEAVTPRNLRTTFANFLESARVSRTHGGYYFGHAGDVFSRHYADYAKTLRDEVVRPLDQWLRKELSRQAFDMADLTVNLSDTM